MELEFINIIDKKDIVEEASIWFEDKWGVPKEAYLECMNAYINGDTNYGWYLCLDGNKIVGGLGVIDNDFHDREDLTPNVCAVYVIEEYRKRGIAGKLLNMVVDDMRKKGVFPLYLLTDHTSFYERYGWEFFVMVNTEEGQSRLYIHK